MKRTKCTMCGKMVRQSTQPSIDVKAMRSIDVFSGRCAVCKKICTRHDDGKFIVKSYWLVHIKTYWMEWRANISFVILVVMIILMLFGCVFNTRPISPVVISGEPTHVAVETLASNRNTKRGWAYAVAGDHCRSLGYHKAESKGGKLSRKAGYGKYSHGDESIVLSVMDKIETTFYRCVNNQL